MNIGPVPSPSKPEKPKAETDPASDNFWTSPFRNRYIVVGSKLPVIPGLSNEDHEAGEKLATYHSKKWQPTNSWIKSVNALEDEWIGCQEEVEKPIDERVVYAEQQNDRLGNQHSDGPGEILLHKLFDVDFDFFLLCVDSPVLGPASQFFGSIE